MKVYLTEPQVRAAIDALNYRLEFADPEGDGSGWCGTSGERAAKNAIRALNKAHDAASPQGKEPGT